MNESVFENIGQGVYTRQRTFSAQEQGRNGRGGTLTEVALFDRLVLPTVESVLSCLQDAAVQVRDYSSDTGNAYSNLGLALKEVDLPEITDHLARGDQKIYEALRPFVPALPQGRGYTHFIRGQTGYLLGEQDFASSGGDARALHNLRLVRSSMVHPQNIAAGFGISGRIEIGVNDYWSILDFNVLRTLMRDNVRKSNTLSVFGRVDEKLLIDLNSEVIYRGFYGQLRWLPDSSNTICESLASQTVGAYIIQQKEAEVALLAGLGAISQMIADRGIPRDHSVDPEVVN